MSNDESRLFALGKYTDAKDRAEMHRNKRYHLVADIKRLLPGDVPSDYVKAIDFAKLSELVQAAAREDAALRQAYDDANAVAEVSGKPRLELARQ